MITPRQLVHRGVLLTHGLYLQGEEASARALRAWAPGAQLWRVGEGVVLRWGSPRRLRVDQVEGAPLALIDGVLWAFPPSEAEREAMGAPSGSLVVARGGEAQVLPLDSPLAPHALLSVELSVLPLEGLGAPPSPTPVAVVAPVVDRARFGVPPADPEARAAIAAQLASGGKGQADRRGAAVRRGVAGGPGEAGPVTAGASLLLGALRRLFSAAPAVEGPGLMNRVLDWLDRTALAGMLRANLRGRYTDYLSQLLDDLEGGEIDRALRTAIPLSDKPGGGSSAGLKMSLPAPRTKLQVLPVSGTISPVSLSSDLFQDLRARYRALAKRLSNEGRFEDAAFVLAELLGQAEEAVLLLERAERFELAADIAEARKLKAARQVALRLRAGQTERAMDLARRAGVMVEAARMLESSAPQLARQLILARVALLAGTGELLAALALLPPGQEPQIEEALLRTALDRGDFLVVALTDRFLGRPQLRPLWLDRARAILDGDESGEVLQRLLVELARQNQARISAMSEGRQFSALCRDGARVAFREQDRGGEVGAEAPASLSVHSQTLAADLQAAPLLPRLLGTVHVARQAEDRGALPIYDAAFAEDHSLLLALGEAGLELRAPGRPPARVPVAAERVYRLGDRVLALVRRGEVWEITRVDLRSGEAERWMDLRAGGPAPALTRGMLLVAEDGGLALYDPLAAGTRALWRSDIKSPLLAIAAAEQAMMHAVVEAQGERELWSWSREDLLLRSRDALPQPMPRSLPGLDAEGVVVEAAASATEPVLGLRTMSRRGAALDVQEHPAVPLPVPGPAALLSVVCAPQGLFVGLRAAEGALALRFATPVHRAPGKPATTTLTLEGARGVGLAMAESETWLAWDELGRVLRLGPRGSVLWEGRS